jgi:predicted RNase H-like HicB family nuclease
MTPRLDAYTIVIRPDDNGTFIAYVPAIDGCQAWGETADQARYELAHVFDMIVEEYTGRVR